MTLLGAFPGNPRDALAHLGGATAFVRYNMPRVPIDASDVGVLTSQVMTSTPIFLSAGDVVTNLTFRSGATALATGSNWWFALYTSDSTPALIGQTADQTSTAWGANTTKTLPLASAYTVTKSGMYWAGVMVNASTVPTLVGARYFPAMVAGERNLGQTSGSSLAATAPATITSATALSFAPLCAAT